MLPFIPKLYFVHIFLQVVVATSEGNLVYIEVEAGLLREKAHAAIKGEISCLDISPIGKLSSSAIILMDESVELMTGAPFCRRKSTAE